MNFKSCPGRAAAAVAILVLVAAGRVAAQSVSGNAINRSSWDNALLTPPGDGSGSGEMRVGLWGAEGDLLGPPLTNTLVSAAAVLPFANDQAFAYSLGPLEPGGYRIVAWIDGDGNAVWNAGEPRSPAVAFAIESNNVTGINVTVGDDSDGDGIADWWEVHWFGDLETAGATSDFDNDGLTDLEEFEIAMSHPSLITLDPTDWDTSGDGMDDWWKWQYYRDGAGLHPCLHEADEDPDGDGLTNLQEYRGTDGIPRMEQDPGKAPGIGRLTGSDNWLNPLDIDTSGDGLIDSFTFAWYDPANGIDPLTPGDPGADPDRDGLTNFREQCLHTPLRQGGVNDLWTLGPAHLPPRNPITGIRRFDPPLDMGTAGLTDLQEIVYALRDNAAWTRPSNDSGYQFDAPHLGLRWNVAVRPGWDTDGDLLPDGWEVEFGLDPRDGDLFLPDGSPNPNGFLGDPDGDGIVNIQEYFGQDGQRDPDEPYIRGSGDETNPNRHAWWPNLITPRAQALPSAGGFALAARQHAGGIVAGPLPALPLGWDEGGDTDGNGIPDWLEIQGEYDGAGPVGSSPVHSMDPFRMRSALIVAADGVALPDPSGNPVRGYRPDLITRAWTLECWVRPGIAGLSGDLIVLPRPIDSHGDFVEFTARLALANGVPLVAFQTLSGKEYQVAGLALPVGQWAHVAGVWNPDDNALNLYVDGIFAQSIRVYEECVSAFQYAMITPPRLADSSAHGGSFVNNLRIDEVRIWGTARTAGEIEAYRRDLVNPYHAAGELRAYFRFDDGGALAEDFMRRARSSLEGGVDYLFADFGYALTAAGAFVFDEDEFAAIYGVDARGAEDTSGDGLPDPWKLINHLDIFSSAGEHGRDGDPDGDGLSNIYEYWARTNPREADTSGNGTPDAWEDADGDGVPNIIEQQYGTRPDMVDTDNNGFTDAEEIAMGTDPTNPLDPLISRSMRFGGGAGDYLEVPIQAKQRLATWTLEAWVRPEAGAAGTIVRRAVQRLPDGRFAANWLLAVESAGADTVAAYGGFTTPAGGEYRVAAAPFAAGEWTHLAVVYDAAGAWLGIYTNGVLGAQTNLMMAIPPVNGKGGENFVRIGESFDGMIDEVRIWNTARPADSLYHYYNRYLDEGMNGLAHYFRFDDGQANENVVPFGEFHRPYGPQDFTHPEDWHNQWRHAAVMHGDVGFASPGAIMAPPSLRVVLQPAEAVDAGARWRMNGGEWRESGVIARNLDRQELRHYLEYLDVAGWRTPAAEWIEVTNGVLTAVVRPYVRHGALTVNLVPADGQWRIDGGPWRASGATVGLAPGEYSVNYGPLADWTAPPAETVTVVSDQTTSLTRGYAAAFSGIRTFIEPPEAAADGAQWRIGDGPWRNSGAIVDLAPGDYTIGYRAIPDWATPPGQAATVTADGLTQVTGTYARIVLTGRVINRSAWANAASQPPGDGSGGGALMVAVWNVADGFEDAPLHALVLTNMPAGTLPLPMDAGYDFALGPLTTGAYRVGAWIDGNANGRIDIGEPCSAMLAVTLEASDMDALLLTVDGDADGDGIPDWWEWLYFGSPTGADPLSDPDGDGINNYWEYRLGADPLNAYSLDPAGILTDAQWDSDGDGLSNWEEIHVWGTDPTNPDTDDDGISDGDEVDAMRLGGRITSPTDARSPLIPKSILLDGAARPVPTPGDFDRFAFDGAWTLEAWVRLDAAGQTGWIIRRKLAAQPANLTLVNFALGLEDGRPVVEFSTDTGQRHYAGGPAAAVVPAGIWTHLAGLFDPANKTLALYVNGIPYQSRTTLRMPAWKGPGATLIGEGLTGRLDELRVWRIARKAEEIAGWYDKTLQFEAPEYDDIDVPGVVHVNPALDAAQLWERFLAGSVPAGISGINVTLEGEDMASGAFNGFPVLPAGMARPHRGIILSTGDARDAAAVTNTAAGKTTEWETPGDPDIDALTDDTSYDAVALTLTFTSDAGIEGISFNVLFASEEFPFYVGSYNDAFGAFLNGENITFDDNGEPLTVNNNFFELANNEPWHSGHPATAGKTPVRLPFEYNGLTPLLTCNKRIAPGTHTLKFVIADVRDRLLDSVVFLSNFRFALAGEEGTAPATPLGADVETDLVAYYTFDDGENRAVTNRLDGRVRGYGAEDHTRPLDWRFSIRNVEFDSGEYADLQEFLNDGSGNGIPDWWELMFFGRTGIDPLDDPDGDGLNNLYEYWSWTSPLYADTDNDGIPDGAHDPDGDGLSNAEEQRLGTHPRLPDTADNGLPDGSPEDPRPASSVVPVIDRVLRLDGLPGSYVEMPNQARFALADWSLLAWVRPDGDATGGRILARQVQSLDGTAVMNYALELDDRRRPVARFTPGDLAGQPDADVVLTAAIAAALPPDEWTHLAATFDAGAGRLSIYVNGDQKAALTTPKRPARTGVGPLWTRAGDGFKGYVDETAIFSRALATNEIAEAMAGMAFRTEMNALVSFYRFDDGTSATTGPAADGRWYGVSGNPDWWRGQVEEFAPGYERDWLTQWRNGGTLFGGVAMTEAGDDAPVAYRAIDTNNDGVPDWWYVQHGYDPFGPSVADDDPDGDGLSNYWEYRLGSDPFDAYSLWRAAGEMGGVLTDAEWDSDRDGLPNWDEIHIHGTDPTLWDTADNGFGDGEEILGAAEVIERMRYYVDELGESPPVLRMHAYGHAETPADPLNARDPLIRRSLILGGKRLAAPHSGRFAFLPAEGIEPDAPEVRIDRPADGSATTVRFVELGGTVRAATSLLSVRLYNNGLFVGNLAIDADGFFETIAIVSAGANLLEVVAIDEDGGTGRAGIEVTGNFQMADIRVTQSWNLPGDLDTWLIDPQGRHMGWTTAGPGYPDSVAERIPGSFLDIDDIVGTGPENITVEQGSAINGQYQVWMNNYSHQGNPLSTVRILVLEGREGEQYVEFGPQAMPVADFNAQNSNAWWHVANVAWPSGQISPAGTPVSAVPVTDPDAPAETIEATSEGWTVEAWIKPLDDQQTGALAEYRLPDGRRPYVLGLRENRPFMRIRSVSGVEYTLEAAPLASNIWTHLAFVHDEEDGSMRIFTNGLAAAGRAIALPMLKAPGRLTIDTEFTPPGDVARVFDAAFLDELRFWSRARGSGILTANMYRHTPPAPALLAYYYFDDGGLGIEDGARPRDRSFDLGGYPLPDLLSDAKPGPDGVWGTAGDIPAGPGPDGHNDYVTATEHAPVITGALRVTIEPQGAALDGAQWRIAGGQWQDGGATLAGMELGRYRIEFAPAPPWTAPAPLALDLRSSATLVATGRYTRASGAQIFIRPPEAVAAGAAWRFVAATAWLESGQFAQRNAGSHFVEFRPVEGWMTPEPFALTVSNDMVSTHRVDYYMLETIGTPGSELPGRFRFPRGLAIDADRNLYVADSGNHRIQVRANGVWSVLGGPGAGAGQFQQPFGVTIDSLGRVYVADANNNRIQRYDPASGAWTVWGGPGIGDTPGRFNGPFDVAVDAQFNVYVADHYNHRVQRRSPDGVWTVLIASGLDTSLTRNPSGVAIDGDDLILTDHVAQTGLSRVRRFSREGAYLGTLPGTAGGTALNKTRSPFSASADSLLAADMVNNRILTFDRSQGIWNILIGGATLNEPEGVAIDVPGFIYIADTGNHRILLLNRSGYDGQALTQFAVARPYRGVAAAGDAGGFAVRWMGRRGWLYTVEYRDDFANGAAWRILPGAERIEGSDGLMQVSDPDAPPRAARFYRIRAY